MAKVQTPEDFFKSLSEETKVEKTVPSVEDVEKEIEEIEEDVELDQEDHEEPIKETDDADTAEEEGDEEVGLEEEDEASEDQDGEDDEDFDGIVFEDDEVEIQEEPDYAKLASELGFEGIKNKEQFVEKYKLDLSKAKEDALEGIPDSLKQAVQFAKEGGDFMEFLDSASLDYDKVPNRDLVEAHSKKYFIDEDGKFDKEAFEDWYDSESKARINMLADGIRSDLKRDQLSKINAIKDKAAKEREAMNAKLKSKLESIDSIGGVKLSQAHKDTMYRDTVSGVAMEELFYEDGKLSSAKVAENLFKVRMFEKAIQVAKSNSKNEGKREVIAKATNANVKRKSEKPKAEVKKVNPLDQFYNILTTRK